MSFAEGPPDLPYPKLPFWRTVGLSYSTYFRYVIDALRTSWLWLILAAVFSAYASWQQWSWMATTLAKLKPDLLPEVSKPLELTVLFALDNILLLLAGVSIAVAWHRLIILDERPGFSGSNVMTGNLWRYIGVTIAIFLIGWLPAAVVMVPALFYLPEAPGSPPPAGFFPVILLVLLLYAVGVAVTLRLSLLLPARAVGDAGLTIKQAWRRSRGNTWRLLWGFFLTTVPPLLLAEIGFVMLTGARLPDDFASKDLVADMTFASTVFSIYYLLIVPIGIGFLSHAYRHFFQAPPEREG